MQCLHVNCTCVFCSLHIVRCNNTSIHDVLIHGDFNTPNNDGIDIEDSNNTLITRCKIDTGDDAICPKTSTGPIYNLTATDCWIRTKSCAIKLGSASWFDFKGLVFNNIKIVDSHRGLGFQIRDGGITPWHFAFYYVPLPFLQLYILLCRLDCIVMTTRIALGKLIGRRGGQAHFHVRWSILAQIMVFFWPETKVKKFMLGWNNRENCVFTAMQC